MTTVLGQDISEQSRNIGRRLGNKGKEHMEAYMLKNDIIVASKYGMQFFVSLDIGNQDEMLIAFTEKKLSEFIKGLLS